MRLNIFNCLVAIILCRAVIFAHKIEEDNGNPILSENGEIISLGMPVQKFTIHLNATGLTEKIEACHANVEPEIVKLSDQLSALTDLQKQNSEAIAKVSEELLNFKIQIPQLIENLLTVQTEKLKNCLKSPLRFHSRSAKNVQVTDEGHTVKLKSKQWGHRTAFTKRQLRTNELFEVVLINPTASYGEIVIGVTIHNPDGYNPPFYIQEENAGAWMIVGNEVFHKKNMIKTTSGPSLKKLNKGDRVGIMRDGDGSLHLYVNGVDEIVADVPANIYGFIELHQNSTQTSIVDC